ncbi:MAG: hypothetical protein ACO1NQ_02605 [Flavobacteriales bacterium]
MSMSNANIQEFGRLLVHLVRDAAVRACDQNTGSNGRSPVAKRWNAAMGDPRVTIPDCVDETVFQLLHAIDQGSIHLSFRNSDGELVDLNAEGLGELAGIYMASGGWRTEFAQERFNDDFANL